MTLTEKVNQYVETHDTNREEIASQLGMNRQSLYNKLNGKTEFTMEEAYKLSRMLGITVDELAEAVA